MSRFIDNCEERRETSVLRRSEKSCQKFWSNAEAIERKEKAGK